MWFTTGQRYADGCTPGLYALPARLASSRVRTLEARLTGARHGSLILLAPRACVHAPKLRRADVGTHDLPRACHGDGDGAKHVRRHGHERDEQLTGVLIHIRVKRRAAPKHRVARGLLGDPSE